MTRYLTPKGEARVLADWREKQRTLMRPAGDAGGNGYVDPEMVPWCDMINEIEGVVTLQSCCGHVLPCADDPGQQYIQPGTLWLWLSGAVARVAYERLWRFAQNPAIDSASLLFGCGREREILDISWTPDRLNDACLLTRQFLCGASFTAQRSGWRRLPALTLTYEGAES